MGKFGKNVNIELNISEFSLDYPCYNADEIKMPKILSGLGVGLKNDSDVLIGIGVFALCAFVVVVLCIFNALRSKKMKQVTEPEELKPEADEYEWLKSESQTELKMLVNWADLKISSKIDAGVIKKKLHGVFKDKIIIDDSAIDDSANQVEGENDKETKIGTKGKFHGVNNEANKITAYKEYVAGDNLKGTKRKTHSYLKWIQKGSCEGQHGLLFNSNVFNYLGVATPKVYIDKNGDTYSEFLEEYSQFDLKTDRTADAVGKLIEKGLISQYFMRNICSLIFGDRDATVFNVMYNEKSKQLAAIDNRNNSLYLLDHFSLPMLFDGCQFGVSARSSVASHDNIFYDTFEKTDEYKLSDKESDNLTDLSERAVDRIKGFRDKDGSYSKSNKDFKERCCSSMISVPKKGSSEKFTKEKMDPDKFLDTIRDNYLVFTRKLLLMNDSDIEIVLKNQEQNIENSEKRAQYATHRSEYITNLKLQQVKVFWWYYKEGNLHKLFGLSRDDEDAINAIFQLPQSIVQDRDFLVGYPYPMLAKKFSKQQEYRQFLENVKASDGYRKFQNCMNLLSCKITKVGGIQENYLSNLFETALNELNRCSTVQLEEFETLNEGEFDVKMPNYFK